eukprot:gnl/TRDRNA2_/TRDRNA2_173396_c0_seq13.p1 gnl/TRDRNA2_/TRDRNA2_173396_c0~~gnl/TRDRNA2_/TRDRNA2_173396_c0_seq13.p1  ORF type:complete len:299 (+),score=156.61 gnl/TRDRNA2_/TRDRNA2_173396_c0_seq13:2-898(+)
MPYLSAQVSTSSGNQQLTDTMADEAQVKGMAQDLARAEEGMKLFKQTEDAEYDAEAATKHKAEVDAQIEKLDGEAAQLSGAANKKARQEKEKEKKALKDSKEYIDACKVVKGLKPPNGNFVKKAGGPTKEQIEADKKAAEEKAAKEAKAAAEAEEKKKKDEEKKAGKPAKESAGISKAERDELEKLKNDIIEKKKTLKEQGMSGGQMNKDPEIVAWVARMNELKEKENPGAMAAQKEEKGGKKKKVLDSAAQALLEEKEKALEEYTEKLRTEFKYSKKEISADPDYCDMKAEIDKMKK